MTALIIQSGLLLAIAFILGCIVGSLLFHLIRSTDTGEGTTSGTSGHAERKAIDPAPLASAPKPAPAGTAEPVKEARAPEKAAVVQEPPATAAKPADDLKRISGIGPQNEAKLNSIGVRTFAEIAGWSAEQQKEIGERLSFPGRIERENWVAQAKMLAEGGTTEFSSRVDRREVESSTGTVEDSSEDSKKPDTVAQTDDGKGDDLTLIEGVGNALASKLNRLGIHHFSQIAGWSEENQVWIGNELGFPGRPQRENWVAEAKLLAEGGAAKKTASARGEIISKRKG